MTALSEGRAIDKLGIDPSAYDAYEAGGEQAPARMLSQIAELLEVSVLWFFAIRKRKGFGRPHWGRVPP